MLFSQLIIWMKLWDALWILGHYAPRENHATWIDRQCNAGRSTGKSVDIEPLFSDVAKHDGTMRERPSYKNLSAPVSFERAATLNILMAQYRRQCYRGRFVCTKARRENRKWEGGRGRRARRRTVSLSNPFFDRSSIPKLARATKPMGPARNRTAASSRKAEIPLSSSGTRLKQGDERCYRLGNIKSPPFCAAF